MAAKAESLLSLDALCNAVSGVAHGTINGIDNFSFTSVATDSRNVVVGSLFVPLLGENQDGHEYIPAAVKNGATVVFAVADSWTLHKEEFESFVQAGLVVVFVPNTLTALQKSAAAYVRKFPNLIRVGITGSNGKTTTKELASSVLSQKYNVVMTSGNLNSETGLPLSVFKINKEHQVGVFEMGMNRINEIQELADVLNPQYAIITNIGTAHIGILGSKDQIAEEKKKIFSNFTKDCVGFVPENDCYSDFLKDVSFGEVKTFGPESMSSITRITTHGLEGTSFGYNNVAINLHLAGQYNLYNSLAVIALAEKIGLSSLEIKAGIEAVKPLNGRGLVKQGKYTLIYDCYNANAESMSESIKFYSSLKHKGKIIFVLGDMLELGLASQMAHEKIGELVGETNINQVYFIGSEMVYAADYAERVNSKKRNNIKIKSIEQTDDETVRKVAEDILEQLEPGDLIMFKGSNGIHLDRIADVIAKKAGL